MFLFDILPAYHLPQQWNTWSILLPDSKTKYSIKHSIKSQILQTYQEYVKCRERYYCNELGEAGVGWSPTRPTTAYQYFPKNNRHNPVMVYNDLMIRYNTVSYYNTNRSQLVTVQCINTRLGRRSTDAG